MAGPPEVKRALIPQVLMITVNGPEHRGVLITDRRLLFVVTSGVSPTAMAIGGVVGAAIWSAVTKTAPANLQQDPVEGLAARKHTISIPFGAIQAIQAKKPFGSSRRELRITYVSAKGRRKKYQIYLEPSAEEFKAGKARGVKPKQLRAQFGMKVVETLRAYLPAAVVAKGRWGT